MSGPSHHLSATLDQPRSGPAGKILGRRLGDFVICAAQDEGAGVYRAVQQSLSRDAIVKVCSAGQPPLDSVVRRFLLETRLAARLDHPYAAHIYAFGAEPDGLLWLAMELVRGTPLGVFIQEHGGLPAERFAPFLQRLAEVIDAAHEAGIIHRDIKPSNVMALARAGALFPKLLDFGVAALVDGARVEGLEAAGAGGFVVGSPFYLAPEQWSRGAEPSRAGDLYSLAVLSFEALSGRVPFDGESLGQIAAAHATTPVPLLAADRPAPVDEVLGKGMAKDPAARYPSAQAFASALAAVTVRPARRLPELPAAVRDTCIVHAPRPLAEAVADLAAAQHPNEMLDAMWQVLSVVIRLTGLIALAARLGSRVARDGERERELLRALRRRSLADGEWLELARRLAAPHAVYRDAYPVPELIDLLAEPEPIASLLTLREATGHGGEARALKLLERALPLLATLLEAVRFLEALPIVGGRAREAFMGIGRERSHHVALATAISDGEVVLASRDGVVLLTLSPLLQVRRPLPSAPEDLFLLEGSEASSARLVSPRAGFMITDAALWPQLESLLSLGDEADREAAPRLERSPYLGLAPFSIDEAESFVGRERDVETFLNRLRVQSFVGVVGPSGAGKSSFVAAGVIPALPPGWRAVMVRPGATPYETLRARLVREGLAGGDARDPPELAAELRRAEAGQRLVLVIDQLEELFTLCHDAVERARYADLLERLALGPDDASRVIVTLRDDFLVRVEQLAALRDRLSQGFHLLSTPAPADLVRILVEPAARAGYDFDDPSLPVEMAAQVADKPGALALLSFTASRLWEDRDRYFRRLTRRAYDAMGGVGGALSRHAEATLAVMSPAEQEMVRVAFRRLVTSEGTRAVVEREEMLQALGGAGSATGVIDRLIAARLLVTCEAELGGEKLEVIHEALLAGWPRLVAWRRDDAEGSRLREQLRAAAEQWHSRGRPRGLLWRDDALAEYRAWRQRFPWALSDLEREFAEASLASARKSRRRRQLSVIGALSVLTAALVVLGLSERRAADNAARAELQVARLHEEKGREALFSGDPLRAIVHLGEALRRGRGGPTLRYPLASAIRELSSARMSLDHGTRIYEASFSPDGEIIATSDDAGVVRIWDARRGTLLRVMRGHRGRVLGLAFDAAGARLVSGGLDGRVRLWDARSGALAGTLDAGAAEVQSVMFVADGARVLAASHDGTVRLWDAATLAPVRTLSVHARSLWSARQSSDGTRLVTASDDGTARVTSIVTGATLATLIGHRGRVLEAAFSPDGRVVATASSDRTIRLWNAEDGRLLYTSPDLTQAMFLLAFSPDGERLVAGGDDKVAVVLRTSSGQLERTLVGHTGYLNSIAVSPDGSTIATAGSDGTVRLWAAGTGQLVTALYGHIDLVWHVRFDAGGHRLVTAGHDGVAKVWDIERTDVVSLRGHRAPVLWASFSPDGRRVFSAGRDGTVREWDAASGDALAVHDLPRIGGSGILGASVDRDGTHALYYDGAEALIVDLAGGGTITLRHAQEIKFGGFSPDGARVLTAGKDGARLWEVATGRPIQSYPWEAVWLGAAALSPDGRRVATVVGDHDIEVLDAMTGSPIARLAGRGLGYASLDFSADGRRLASASQDRTAKIWDVERGRVMVSLEGHLADVLAARFSPDGQLVVTAGSDGAANLWDAVTGELLTSFTGPQQMNSAAFSPDGKRIVVAGDDHVVRIWSVEADARSPAEVAAFARCASPFRLEGARLVRAQLEGAACRREVDGRAAVP